MKVEEENLIRDCSGSNSDEHAMAHFEMDIHTSLRWEIMLFLPRLFIHDG